MEVNMTELKRILLVEDNPKDVELTLAALGHHHLANEVIVAKDGIQALAILRKEGEYQNQPGGHPGIILLDLKMPKVDGLEVLKQIKQDPELKMIPVVMLTSSKEERDLVQSYKLGVNAYVVKPVDFGEFVSAVRDIGAFWAILNEPPPGSLKKAE
jgi:CheY-like chemotaxis protein